jgi:GT2 family glycosyltransferase
MSLSLCCGLVIYDEIEEIQRLIPQLKSELSSFNLEWVFVLNHEQAEIRKWIKTWLSQQISNEKVSCFENPLNNLGFARQLILTHSTSELIYLVDPDIELQAKSVLKLVELSMATQQPYPPNEVIGYGGQVTARSENVFLQNTFDLVSRLSKFSPFAFQTQNHQQTRTVDHLPTCHLLLKKSIALKVGGFSHLLGRCGEDIDFTHRAFKMNYRFIFLPTSQVIHWQNLSILRWYYKIFCFGRAQISVQKINYRHGLRLYRLLPLILLIFTLGLCLSSAYLSALILFTLVLFSLVKTSLFGFFMILFSYSVGGLIETISLLFGSKNAVPLQELNRNLTFQLFETNSSKFLDSEI